MRFSNLSSQLQRGILIQKLYARFPDWTKEPNYITWRFPQRKHSVPHAMCLLVWFCSVHKEEKRGIICITDAFSLSWDSHLGWSSHVLLGGTSREFQNSRVTRKPKSILDERKHHALLLPPTQQFPQMATQLQERLHIFRAAYVFNHIMKLCLTERTIISL